MTEKDDRCGRSVAAICGEQKEREGNVRVGAEDAARRTARPKRTERRNRGTVNGGNRGTGAAVREPRDTKRFLNGGGLVTAAAGF